MTAASLGFLSPSTLLSAAGVIGMAAALLAAVAGDQVGYLIGRGAGRKVFTGRQSRFFKQSHVDRSERFFDRYGARTILLARFVPVVRTFAPVIAGVSRVHYRTFVLYNVIGGVVWGCGVLLLGHALGGVAFIRNNVEIILALIVVASVVPIGVELLRARRERASGGGPAAGEGSGPDGERDRAVRVR